MNSLREALGLVFAMGAVILFCRASPFLFFSRNKNDTLRMKVFLDFIEKTVPPVAMTVLALNEIASSFLSNIRGGFLVLAASLFTALLHLWKRNALVSIFAGTAVYMILIRIVLKT